MTSSTYMCQLHTYIDTRSDAIYVSMHTRNGKSVKENVSKRGKRREMGWKETLVLLLPSECQVIYFVNPSHIFYERKAKREIEREESPSCIKKRVVAVLLSPCYINSSSLIIIVVCCCYCCCCSALCSCYHCCLCMCVPRDLFSHRRSSSFSSYMWRIY